MSGQNKAIQQYLKLYAEPEAKTVLEKIAWPKTYQHCLLIPAFKESPDLIDHLVDTAKSNPELLIILIVNRPDNCLDKTYNQPLIERVFQLDKQQQAAPSDPDSQFQLFKLNATSDLLFIDRGQNHPPIPYKQGVGLARKIAADIAAALINRGIIKNQWINSTDADTLIPKGYFSNTAKIDAEQYAAVVHPFQHVTVDTAAISPAMKVYELRLHHYVDGLRRAGSPYAYHTLGSCISCSLIHYCQVRGYPKRAAAEDFYLLNKLRKSGQIFQHQMHEMKIISRHSDRVPFGTGPAVSNLAESENPELENIFYHPKCFEALKLWLDWAPALYSKAIPASEQALIEELHAFRNSDTSAALVSALFSIDFKRGIEHCQKQGKSQQAFDRHFLNWFDGFRTLKLIHHLRDHAYPNLNNEELES